MHARPELPGYQLQHHRQLLPYWWDTLYICGKRYRLCHNYHVNEETEPEMDNKSWRKWRQSHLFPPGSWFNYLYKYCSMYNRKQQNTWKNGYAHRSHILFMGQYRMAVRGSDWKPDPFSRVQHQLGAIRFRFRKPTSGWYRHWRSVEWCPSLCCPEVWSVHRWFSIKICFGLLQPWKRARPFRIPTSKFYFQAVEVLVVQEWYVT